MGKEMTTCKMCDGSGRVHSHNNICWTCDGCGEVPIARSPTKGRSIGQLLVELNQMTRQLTSTANDPIDPLHMAIGMSGEAGELLEMAMGLSGKTSKLLDTEKKVFFQGHPCPDKIGVVTEVGDVLFYVSGYLRSRGYTLRECLVAVIAKLRYRYPDGSFSAEKSQDRDEGGELAAITHAVLTDTKESQC